MFFLQCQPLPRGFTVEQRIRPFASLFALGAVHILRQPKWGVQRPPLPSLAMVSI